MKKLNDKTKAIITLGIMIIIIIAIIIVIFLLYKDLKSNQNNTSVIEENKIYATVNEVGNNYIKIISTNGEEYLLTTNDDLGVGDFIVVYYNSNDNELLQNTDIEVITKSEEVITEKTATESTTITSNNSTTSKITTTESITTTQTNNNTATSVTDDDSLLNFVKEKYNSIDTETIKDNAKNSFITIVDFIFYDGTINGITWDELKSSTKAKVLYYVLLMDNKIENKWPNYKENIGNKYNDLKSKLIASYIDITTQICSEHSDECENTKNDFALLKTSLNLTWDVVKSAFSYAYNKGTTALINWYEVFSGKQ